VEERFFDNNSRTGLDELRKRGVDPEVLSVMRSIDIEGLSEMLKKSVPFVNKLAWCIDTITKGEDIVGLEDG